MKTGIDTLPKRKIIQIATDEMEVFALCNDGTVWQYDGCKPHYWVIFEPIPQSESTEGEDIL